VRAEVVRDIGTLAKYPQTGHSALTGKVRRDWQDTETVLAYSRNGKKKAALEYEKFVKEGIRQGSCPELVGGGLVRSLGGWAQVVSSRRKRVRVSSDYRILGSNEFAEGLLLEADEREKETLRLSAKARDLASLAGEVAERGGVPESELRSGAR